MSDKADTKAPIEDYFPVAQVNEIARKESGAKHHYRPLYYMHKWWARRLGSIFRTIAIYTLADDNTTMPYKRAQFKMPDDPAKLWQYYLEDLDLGDKTVLDPFMGAGITLGESLRLGCKTIGCDLNPISWFIVKKSLESINPNDLKNGFQQLKEEVEPDIRKYYKTSCPHCMSGISSTPQNNLFSGSESDLADALYYFWVKKLECLDCGKKVRLFKNYWLSSSHSNDGSDIVVCPDCRDVFKVKKRDAEINCETCNKNFHPVQDSNATSTLISE